MNNYIEGQQRTGRILMWRLHNTQQYNEEVGIRTRNNEDCNRLDHQDSSL
jgi:hypothetical protein